MATFTALVKFIPLNISILQGLLCLVIIIFCPAKVLVLSVLRLMMLQCHVIDHVNCMHITEPEIADV